MCLACASFCLCALSLERMVCNIRALLPVLPILKYQVPPSVWLFLNTWPRSLTPLSLPLLSNLNLPPQITKCVFCVLLLWFEEIISRYQEAKFKFKTLPSKNQDTNGITLNRDCQEETTAHGCSTPASFSHWIKALKSTTQLCCAQKCLH